MRCCGKSRPAPQAAGQVQHGSPPPVAAPRPAPKAQYFEYVGKTGLTALGPVTGRHYRFARPGVVLAVDHRDGASMAGVPNLRRVVEPE